LTRHQLAHALRRAARSLWENAGLNAAAIASLATALLLVGSFGAAAVNLRAWTTGWGQDVHVSAYFAPGTSEQAQQAVLQDLKARSEVAAVSLVTAQDASDWLRGKVDGVGPVLDELGPNALPASAEIALKPEIASDPAKIAAFATAIARPELSDIDYGAAWVARFQTFLAFLGLVGAVLGVLVLGTAAFVVLGTVYLVVYSRRDEVEIQKLVGATPAFILAPFLIEGAICGVLGSGFALGGLWGVHRVLVEQLRDSLGLGAAGPLALLPPGGLALLAAAGPVLGTVSAGIAAWRFLRRAP